MATKLSIFNLAFAHLGEATVTTLTDDPVAPNVAKMEAQWDQALHVALVQAPFLCGMERRSLPVDVAPPEGWPDWKYPYRFTCPLGTLKVWTVEGCEQDAAWERGAAIDENGAARVVIWAQSPGPLRTELQRRRPPEALSPLVVDGLGMLLASRTAGSIQQNEQAADKWLKRANDAFLLAEGSEATEIGGQAPMIGTGGLAAARASAL